MGASTSGSEKPTSGSKQAEERDTLQEKTNEQAPKQAPKQATSAAAEKPKRATKRAPKKTPVPEAIKAEAAAPSPAAKRRAEQQAVLEVKDLAASNALVLLTMLDGLMVFAFGDYAAMTEQEREMIEPPLSRMVEKIDLANNELLQKWSDPLLVLFGLGLWGWRVVSTKQELEKIEKPKPQETETETETEDSNPNGWRPEDIAPYGVEGVPQNVRDILDNAL